MTTPQVIFAGGRMETIKVENGTIVQNTNSSTFDNNYADCSLEVYINYINSFSISFFTESSNILSPISAVSGDTLFLHFEVKGDTSGAHYGGQNPITFKDSSGYPWISLRVVTANTLTLMYNSGTGTSPVWSNIDSNTLSPSSNLEPYDFEITLGSPHSVKMYRNGSLIRSGTFTQAALTNLASCSFMSFHANIGASTRSYYSQILATIGISTIGAKVKTCRATGAGAHTDWSNSYTAVNEVIVNDATIQNATTSGLVSTHVMSDVTVPTGYEIKSIFHWLRAKNDGSSPANIKSVLRMGGTDYSTGNLSGIGAGYSPTGARYDSDPSGSNWTESVWNGIEAGYESST